MQVFEVLLCRCATSFALFGNAELFTVLFSIALACTSLNDAGSLIFEVLLRHLLPQVLGGSCVLTVAPYLYSECQEKPPIRKMLRRFSISNKKSITPKTSRKHGLKLEKKTGLLQY